MSLGDFLGDQCMAPHLLAQADAQTCRLTPSPALGSWADEMEDAPMPGKPTRPLTP